MRNCIISPWYFNNILSFLNILNFPFSALYIQCVVGYAKMPKSYFFMPSKRLIGKRLARHQQLSSAKATRQNERYRKQIIIQRQIDAEASHLCSTGNGCGLRVKIAESLVLVLFWNGCFAHTDPSANINRRLQSACLEPFQSSMKIAISRCSKGLLQ